MRRRIRGFTLVELSLVLLALGLILPAAVMYWQFSERHRVAAVQINVQQQSRDALLGFVHSQYRLPCPAANSDGVESCFVGTELRQVGYLPWRTLSLPRPEAGALRYGVHREPTAVGLAEAPIDRDLAVARDRLNPLRVRTPAGPVKNHSEAPNPHAPPIPEVLPSLGSVLGMTQSGNAASPLNSACDTKSAPPCPVGVARAVNLLDICLALNTASDTLEAPAGRLATRVGLKRRPAAFVIAAPGLLDANGNGQGFDGDNANASDSDPTFAAAGAAASHDYDDIVLAATHTELFAELQCGGALSAISHAHFNASTGAFVMERALYDYRDQLYIAVVLAEADQLAGAAGVLAGASGILAAAKGMVSAVADTTLSVGARSYQIGMAGVGIGLAAASATAAGFALADAVASLKEARDVFEDFAPRTTAMTELSGSVAENALTADAIGH